MTKPSDMWSRFLASKGMKPVEAMGPVLLPKCYKQNRSWLCVQRYDVNTHIHLRVESSESWLELANWVRKQLKRETMYKFNDQWFTLDWLDRYLDYLVYGGDRWLLEPPVVKDKWRYEAIYNELMDTVTSNPYFAYMLENAKSLDNEMVDEAALKAHHEERLQDLGTLQRRQFRITSDECKRILRGQMWHPDDPIPASMVKILKSYRKFKALRRAKKGGSEELPVVRTNKSERRHERFLHYHRVEAICALCLVGGFSLADIGKMKRVRDLPSGRVALNGKNDKIECEREHFTSLIMERLSDQEDAQYVIDAVNKWVDYSELMYTGKGKKVESLFGRPLPGKEFSGDVLYDHGAVPQSPSAPTYGVGLVQILRAVLKGALRYDPNSTTESLNRTHRRLLHVHRETQRGDLRSST